jgi:hypothetical protein
VPGERGVEMALHDAVRERSIRGEWFELHPSEVDDLARWVEGLARAIAHGPPSPLGTYVFVDNGRGPTPPSLAEQGAQELRRILAARGRRPPRVGVSLEKPRALGLRAEVG